MWIAKGQAPLVDFCNRSEPRARSAVRPNLAHRRAIARLPASCSRVAVRRGWRGQPSGLGPGAAGFSPARTSTRDRSRVELHPDPMGSSTSRCRPVTAWCGVESTRTIPREGSWTSRPRCHPKTTPVSPIREDRARQGRVARASAKTHAFGIARGAFRPTTVPVGPADSPQAVPSLWSEGDALSITAPMQTDVNAWLGDSSAMRTSVTARP